ncbi:hypothetical protein [Deinococcus sp. NW-56]|uniref:hypothetical protein n=1 Tax=Deinococcus sp. NW-56 TaxID=2080419 RepID=UPI000CF3AEEB|nr:hypothetical protein [Deinococcus sp. NW-56]
MTRHTALLLAASALLVGSAGAQSAQTDELTPTQWPELERATRAVPGFAGLAYVWVDGGKYLVPALTDVNQEEKARGFLRGDRFWKTRFQPGVGVSRGYHPARFSGVQLVQAAQVLKKHSPNLTVRINTSRNRVVVYAPPPTVQRAAKAAGVSERVQSAYEQPPKVVFDVQPRVFSLGAIRATPLKLGRRPDISVRVTNPTGTPVIFHPKCGAVIVHVTRPDGSPVPPAQGAVCADVLEVMLLQPGQTITLPASPHSDLAALPPGEYRWVVGESTFPFTLTR